MKNKFIILISLLFFIEVSLISQDKSYQIAVLKYNGGGDWYANPTSLPNLIKFCNAKLNTNIEDNPAKIDVGSNEIFSYPFLHLTGHGNIVFSNQEAENLRSYLLAGGFLHISDNYGLDEFIRPQMKLVFPDIDFIELPNTHKIYHQYFDFNNGLPKIHQHDDKSPQGFGLYYEGRLICFYDYECDLGDGWEDQEVHGDSEDTRIKALKMGANILMYALMGGEF